MNEDLLILTGEVRRGFAEMRMAFAAVRERFKEVDRRLGEIEGRLAEMGRHSRQTEPSLATSATHRT